MYGDKDEKRARLEKVAALIALHPEGITQARLAEALGAARSTICRDVAALERLGVLLAEDEAGRLTLFGRRR